MKKNILLKIAMLSAAVIILSGEVAAQRIEIIPFAGYMTSARINGYQGYFRVNDGVSLGATADLGQNAYKIELSYCRTGSSLTYYPDDNSDPSTDNLAVHYVSVGGILEFFQGDPVVPFVKVGLGGAYYKPIDSETGSENLMHFDISGGTKLYVSDHLGFRIQASLLLPVFFEGLYFGETAPAESDGMNAKITGIQGNLTTGVVLRF
jgi:hypothetical protein